MPKVTIRYQQLSDAQRFYEILNNPNFIYFSAKPESAKDEKKFLWKNPKKRKNNLEYNYSILFNGKIVGGVGIKINQHRKYIGEIGYFIDEVYWKRGIATEAVKLVEETGFNRLGLKRIEILMNPKNKASEKVAKKCGYKKEGLLRKIIKRSDSKMDDALIYAKTK